MLPYVDSLKELGIIAEIIEYRWFATSSSSPKMLDAFNNIWSQQYVRWPRNREKLDKNQYAGAFNIYGEKAMSKSNIANEKSKEVNKSNNIRSVN